MQRFKDKFALITGGTNGMGFATARQFISEGGKVIITGRSAERVNKAAEQLGGNAFGIVSDAGSMKDILLLQENLQKLQMLYCFLLRRKPHIFMEQN